MRPLHFWSLRQRSFGVTVSAVGVPGMRRAYGRKRSRTLPQRGHRSGEKSPFQPSSRIGPAGCCSSTRRSLIVVEPLIQQIDVGESARSPRRCRNSPKQAQCVPPARLGVHGHKGQVGERQCRPGKPDRQWIVVVAGRRRAKPRSRQLALPRRCNRTWPSERSRRRRRGWRRRRS